MAVVNVSKKWSGRRGGAKQENGVNNISETWSDGYTVLVDYAPSGPSDALFAVGIPSIGQSYDFTPATTTAGATTTNGSGIIYIPGYNEIWCVNKYVETVNPYLYTVVCEYAGRLNPLYEEPERHWSFYKSSEPVDRDYQGKTIVNPNGERYTGLTREVSDPVYVFVRNETIFSMQAHVAYHDAVNSDSFMGYDAKKARLVDITADNVISGQYYYWRVTYKFQFRIYDDWRQRILVEGHKYYTGQNDSNGRRIYEPFYTDTSLSVVDPKPHPLGSNGTRLANEENPTTHTWQYVDTYTPMSFSTLGIT